MTRPNIQIDDLVREMTEEEYEALLATGWTDVEPVVDEPVADEPVVDEPVADETPVVDESVVE
jgi:hypothetical protein